MTFTSVVLFSSVILTRAALSIDLAPEGGTRNGKATMNYVEGGTNYDKVNSNSISDAEYIPNASKGRSQRFDMVDMPIEIIIKSTITLAKMVLKQIEPITLKVSQALDIEDKNYNISCLLSDPTIHSLSKMMAPKMVSEVLSNKLEFALNFPILNITRAKYDLDGKLKFAALDATGEMRMNITNLDVAGSVKYGFVRTTMQVKSLQFDFDFTEITVAATNLSIATFPEEKINALLGKLMGQYLKKEGKKVSQILADRIKDMINTILRTLL